MYAGLVNEEKSSRITFPARFRNQWDQLLERKGIGQQEAIERLIEFLLGQDDVTQSMILKQIEPAQDVMALAIKRMGKARSRPPAS